MFTQILLLICFNGTFWYFFFLKGLHNFLSWELMFADNGKFLWICTHTAAEKYGTRPARLQRLMFQAEYCYSPCQDSVTVILCVMMESQCAHSKATQGKLPTSVKQWSYQKLKRSHVTADRRRCGERTDITEAFFWLFFLFKNIYRPIECWLFADRSMNLPSFHVCDGEPGIWHQKYWK